VAAASIGRNYADALLFLKLDFPRLAILHPPSPSAFSTHELPWVCMDFLISSVSNRPQGSAHVYLHCPTRRLLCRVIMAVEKYARKDLLELLTTTRRY
jgi:hypothetical protein